MSCIYICKETACKARFLSLGLRILISGPKYFAALPLLFIHTSIILQFQFVQPISLLVFPHAHPQIGIHSYHQEGTARNDFIRNLEEAVCGAYFHS